MGSNHSTFSISSAELTFQHSKLRIGFDAKRAFNNNTGLGNYSRFVIEGMLKAYPEHEYYLFTPKISAPFEDFAKGHANVHIITPQNFLAKMAKSLWRTFALSGLSRRFKLDVFHGLSNELPSGITSFRGRKVVTIHDLIFLRYPQYYKPIDLKIYTRKFRQACADADVVVAASQQTADDIVSFFGTKTEKIQVVYQGCNEQFGERLTEAQKQEIRNKYNLPSRFIVCIGTVEARKNQLTVLKAYHQSGITESLVFVGRQTAYAQQLHEYIEQHNLQKQVLFIEGASFSHFPAFYQLAELAVYASEFEGFGIPVLEGLKSKTRMIVALTSSLPEVGGDAVSYFEAGNEAQLSQLIRETLLTEFPEVKAEEQLAKFNTAGLMQQLHACYVR